MKPIGHVMILASAGSGKTYALTNRFVRLLAAGVPAERIAALTFTRKAAGEFFDEILHKLGQAAADPVQACRIAGEIHAPSLGCADFCRMLRGVVEAMHRLNLGTLDGFFARIVRAFPLELGLSGDFEIVEEHAARIERRRVLDGLFAAGRPHRDFVEAFRRATFGVEEKRLRSWLESFLDQYGEVYLAAPDGELWGKAERIWPEGCFWPKGMAAAPELEWLRSTLPWDAMTDGQRDRWEAFLGALPEWAPGAQLPKPVGYILGNVFDVWPNLEEIRIERKKMALPPTAREALALVAGGIVGAELRRRMEMTRGIYSVLRGYEAVYDGAVRRAGRLTFADLQLILRPDIPGGAPALSGEAAGEARLFIDWRLDARIDHWLLDEFQDTSFGQWSVLRNLIDEAVQDPTATRSFFYVGDVKQAIFAWREGDSRLFREIFHHYNDASPGVIAEQRLTRSWRSGPSVP